MLNKEQLEQFENDGFLLIEEAITPAHLQNLQSVTAELIETSRQVRQSNDIYDLDHGHSAASPRLTRIKQPAQQNPAFMDVVRSGKVLSILKAILGPNIALQTSKLNVKAPGGGAAVEWHQDWAFYPHTNDSVLALGLMLDDVDEKNGPLMAIPGSHKGPVLNHHKNGVFAGAIDPDDPLFDLDRAVSLQGRAGDMTIHHVRTLHGSAPNRSDRSRMMVFYECVAADAWPLAGTTNAIVRVEQQDFYAAMQKRMICGEPALQPRLEAVPVRIPLPPAPNATSIFKTQESAGAKSAFASS